MEATVEGRLPQLLDCAPLLLRIDRDIAANDDVVGQQASGDARPLPHDNAPA
jgi:hypothetical protein